MTLPLELQGLCPQAFEQRSGSPSPSTPEAPERGSSASLLPPLRNSMSCERTLQTARGDPRNVPSRHENRSTRDEAGPEPLQGLVGF